MHAGAPGEQTATAARVPWSRERVGRVESKATSPPRQTRSLTLFSVCLQARHYCLPWQAVAGRGPSAGVCATCFGTFGPSDPPLEILSPFTRAKTFMTYVHTIKWMIKRIFSKGYGLDCNISPRSRVRESLNPVCITGDWLKPTIIHYFSFKYRI